MPKTMNSVTRFCLIFACVWVGCGGTPLSLDIDGSRLNVEEVSEPRNDAGVTPAIIEPETPSTAKRVWPQGFVPADREFSTERLCELPEGYLERGQDPEFLPCRVEVDFFAREEPSSTVRQLKVVSWNIEFGKKSAELLEALQTHSN